MVFTWVKYGKPDVSMSLNASLAGLVAITAPCDVTDAFGAIVIGAVSGLLVCFGVWLLDYKLRIDDPVGAVAVHFMNGLWGTLATGLFATKTAPEEIKWTFLWWWIWIIKDSDYRYCLCLRLDSRDDQFNIYNYQSNDWSSCNRRRRDHRSGWTRTWFNISICWIQYDGYF